MKKLLSIISYLFLSVILGQIYFDYSGYEEIRIDSIYERLILKVAPTTIFFLGILLNNTKVLLKLGYFVIVVALSFYIISFNHIIVNVLNIITDVLVSIGLSLVLGVVLRSVNSKLKGKLNVLFYEEVSKMQEESKSDVLDS